MTPDAFRYGLHVRRKYDPRQPVAYDALTRAAATCAPPFDPAGEQYLTAFRFDRSVIAHLRDHDGSSAGFAGAVWSPELHFDLDAADDLAAALTAGRRLAGVLLQRYPKLGEDDLRAFYSGGRSVHLGLPLTHLPDPSPTFHAVAGLLARRLARLAGADSVPGVAFDAGNYDRVRLWRLVNSRHAGTGLYKVRLSYDELMHLDPGGVRKLAAAPRPSDPPGPVGELIGELEHDWNQAAGAVAGRLRDKEQRAAAERAAGGPDRLNRATLAFIAGGADVGDRHRLLYSAAANLAEFACPPKLAHALLTPAALDAGLAPADARRQIDCGLADGATGEGG